MKCETVKIQSGDSYTVINKSDFDSAEHELYQAAITPAKTKIKQAPLSEKKSKAKS